MQLTIWGSAASLAQIPFGQSEPLGVVPRLGSEEVGIAGQGCSSMPLTSHSVCSGQTHSASRPHDLFTVQAVMRCSP